MAKCFVSSQSDNGWCAPLNGLSRNGWNVLGRTFQVLVRRVEVMCRIQSTGRSSKTSAIVIAAKMRARRRRKCFHHKTGWRENGCTGASVVLLTSVKTFADKKQIC
jgi:hypothetical protein